ncbi:AraC family transcriptional regulator [Sorangium sp. So ce1389]|uniref:AraC family transcriptional regulator n=1 Tax=Sorangium sp. So ce1389 TaxID=3133336 RepID=UPI003F5F70C1
MLLPPKATGLAASGGVARPWPSVLATWGPGERSTLHAHHCWHLVLALDGDLQVRTADESPPRPGGAILTAPDVAHAIDASGTRVLIVFVEPESDVGDGLAQALGASKIEVMGSEMADRLRSRVVAAPGEVELAAALPGVLEALGIAAPPSSLRPRHPGVQRVLRRLRADAGREDTSLEALARVARLSPGAAMGLALLLVAMFPANVHAARAGLTLGGSPVTPLLPRTLMQIVFIAATVAVTIGARRRSRNP